LCLALIEQAHADIAHHKRAYANSIQAQEMTSGQVYRLRCAEINSKSAKTFLKSGWVTEFTSWGLQNYKWGRVCIMQSWVKLRKDAVWGEPDSTKKHQNQPIVVRTKQYQSIPK